MLEIGGSDPRSERRELRAAAAFDPANGRWRKIRNVPSGVSADGAATVWTGSRLFVFGGSEPPGAQPNGIAGLYSPSSNNWTVTPPAPVRLPSDNLAAAWSGRRVVLAAASGSGPDATLGSAAYNPATDRWQKLPVSWPIGHDPLAVEMVATSHGILLWSLWSRSHRTGANGFVVYSGIDVFRLIDGAWRPVTGTWPQNRTVDQPLFTGSRVLLGADQIWCGTCSHPPIFDANSNSWSVDPETLAIAKLPHGPLDDMQPQIMWSGSAEIALNMSGEITDPHEDVLPGDIAFLDLATAHWYRGPRAPRQLAPLRAVWDGSHVLALDQQGQMLAYGP